MDFFKLKLLVLFICADVQGLKKDFAMPRYGNALARAVVEIIEGFYVEQSNTLNFYHASIDDESKERNLDIMNEILYQVQSKVVVQLEGYSDFKPTSRKRMHNIFFIDSYESFWNIFRLMSPYYFEYQGFYLIVLTTYNQDQYFIMKEIFEWLWAEYIVNVNIIWQAPENDNEAIMYTYFPYSSFFCGKAVPIQLNQFRFGRWLHSHPRFFPDKMLNLHGCPLTVATVFTPPFMIITTDANGVIYFDGIDGVLLRVLSQRMNFTVNLVQVDDQGSISMNRTSSGAMKMVLENKANLTIGYISTTATRNMFLTSSYIYFTSNLVWITSPGRLLTSIEKLYQPFSDVIWICVLVVFVISYIAIRAVKLQKRVVQSFVFGSANSSPCLNIVNIFFGGSLPKLPIRNFARTLLALFMIYCLIIRSSYTGALFNFMRQESRVKNAESIREMIERNFTFFVLESSQEFIEESPRVAERATIVKRQQLGMIQKLLLDSSTNGALLSSEEHTAYLNANAFPENYFSYAKEVFFSFNLCLYMHRQSCLEEQINQQIIQFKSNGLLDSWVKHFVDRSYLKEKKTNGPKVLVNEQLFGAYELLAFGLTTAMSQFLIELALIMSDILQLFSAVLIFVIFVLKENVRLYLFRRYRLLENIFGASD